MVGQIALSLVVLVGAGLYLRTLQNLRRIDTGFNQRNLVVFRLDPSLAGYTKARLSEFYQRVLSRLGKVPGVTSSAISRFIPLSDGASSSAVLVPGHHTGFRPAVPVLALDRPRAPHDHLGGGEHLAGGPGPRPSGY